LAWCLATFVAATIPLPAATWIAPAAPTPGYWQIAWRGWSYVFDCGGAVFDMCKMCSYTEITYLSVRKQWIIAPSGVIRNPTGHGGCGMRTTVTLTTTWGVPIRAGTVMRAEWYFADFDPMLSDDCTGQAQDYILRSRIQWTTPANGGG
jgi:hypothetical protein